MYHRHLFRGDLGPHEKSFLGYLKTQAFLSLDREIRSIVLLKETRFVYAGGVGFDDVGAELAEVTNLTKKGISG